MVIENEDNSVSFSDVTNYTVKEGSFFGAKDVNRINIAVNAIMAALENGTDLYAAFTKFFEKQKELFEAESEIKQEDLADYIAELKLYMAARWDELKIEYENNIEDFENAQKNDFLTWFQTIKDQLGNDAAGNLQNQISSINAVLREITEEEIDAIITGTYESAEGGMEPDIYSRVTDEEIENAVKNAFRG